MNKENISFQLTAALKESAIVALLEDYAKFSIRNGADIDMMSTNVGEIISTAMDRGDASAATNEHLSQFFAKYTPESDLLHRKLVNGVFIDHVLTDELSEVADDGCMSESLKQLKAARVAYQAALNAARMDYHDNVIELRNEFVNKYKSLFNEQYVKAIIG